MKKQVHVSVVGLGSGSSGVGAPSGVVPQPPQQLHSVQV